MGKRKFPHNANIPHNAHHQRTTFHIMYRLSTPLDVRPLLWVTLSHLGPRRHPARINHTQLLCLCRCRLCLVHSHLSPTCCLLWLLVICHRHTQPIYTHRRHIQWLLTYTHLTYLSQHILLHVHLLFTHSHRLPLSLHRHSLFLLHLTRQSTLMLCHLD